MPCDHDSRACIKLKAWLNPFPCNSVKRGPWGVTEMSRSSRCPHPFSDQQTMLNVLLDDSSKGGIPRHGRLPSTVLRTWWKVVKDGREASSNEKGRCQDSEPSRCRRGAGLPTTFTYAREFRHLYCYRYLHVSKCSIFCFYASIGSKLCSIYYSC